MKKIILFISILLMPYTVLAYSKYIYPGGETIGIEINSDGVMVIGFYEIKGKINRGNPNLKMGDYIIKVNEEDVKSVRDMTNIIEKFVDDNYVEITYRRNKEIHKTKLDLILDKGLYKTGLYVKDSITGIGTLSYIDPNTRIFGALGHEINESNSNNIVEIKSGIIFRNYITGIDRSSIGHPGSKSAKFYYNTKYGNIYKNTNMGIFGNYYKEMPDKKLVEVAPKEDVKIGKAVIKTVIDGEQVQNFDIEIKAINETSDIKNITFEIIDKKLINITGGIVQGMSGSPIIQDNKIVGVVTHVIIDNPLSGYGIFITNMLSKGES